MPGVIYSESEGKLPHFAKRSKEDGKLEFYLDYSMLSAFMRCDRLFYYQHIRSIRLRGGLAFSTACGGWWSDVLSELYEMLFAVQKQDESSPALVFSSALDRNQVMLTAAFCWLAAEMDSYADQPGYANFVGDKNSKFSLRDPVKLVTRSGKTIDRVSEVFLPEGAQEMLSKYIDWTLPNDATNWKILATESGFGYAGEVLIGETAKFRLYLIGRPDLVVYERASGKILTIDHKTVDSISEQTVSRWKPGFQFIGYCLATDQLLRSLGHEAHTQDYLINLAAREEPPLKPRNGAARKPRFHRVRFSVSTLELAEYKQSLMTHAQRLFEDLESSIWAMNDTQCSARNGVCEFRNIDVVAPQNRELIINSQYMEVKPWKPYDPPKAGDEAKAERPLNQKPYGVIK